MIYCLIQYLIQHYQETMDCPSSNENSASFKENAHTTASVQILSQSAQNPVNSKLSHRGELHQQDTQNGIHLQVSQENINLYLERFTKIMKDGNNIPRLHSIQKFRKDVHSNTILRSYFQGALDSIPETVPSIDQAGRERPGILYDMSIDQVLDLLNVVVQTPPSFSFSDYSGVPILVLMFDIKNSHFGTSLFSMPQVNHHLKNIFNDYGNMLKSPKSLEYMNDKEGGWLCKEAVAKVNYDHFVCNTNEPHFGFKSWNDWFTRQLVPGARPVDGEGDPLVIVNAAESYPLTTLSLPFRNVKAVDKFWLKQNRYSLYDMFQAERLGVKNIIDESFVGGTVYQGFLSPWCYHCWHSPVDGYVEKAYHLPGSYYMQNPSLDLNGINNYIDSQAFLSCVSARFVFIIQTNDPRVGRVAIIYIGMAEVSGCIPTVFIGDHVEKGQPIGRFEFGGSSHLIVFDKRANLNFNPKIYDREVKNGFETSTHQPINSWLAKVIPK